MELTETRKSDELADQLDRIAESLTALWDRVAALDERLDRQDEKVKALIEVTGKQAEVQTADQAHYRAIAEVLASHKVSIEDMQKILRRAATGPSGTPLRTVN